MTFVQMNISGDANIGFYGFATDSYCLMGVENKKVRNKIHSILKVQLHECAILNTELAGLFVSGNSSGIVITKIVKDYEMPKLRKYFDNVLALRSRYTALGNLILMNDKGIILSPLLKKHRNEMKEFFGLPCEISTISKQRIVGTLGFATNNGCILHPKARKYEIEKIENTLGVGADIGTVNFGSPYPGSGLIANSNGFIASESTSGPELGRINEALGFL